MKTLIAYYSRGGVTVHAGLRLNKFNENTVRKWLGGDKS